MKNFDIIIIGAGPGGYVAAIRGAQLGAKVAVIEKEEVGGTCLNWGCIPTKSLINSVETACPGINFSEITQRKNEVVKKLRLGVEGLFKARKIELFKGTGKFNEKRNIEVSDPSGKIIEELEGKNIIIASGSIPFELPNMKFNRQNIISSNEVINLLKTPKDLIIVGGGVIGCEFANIFSHLGVKVTIIEMLDTILPGIDKEIAKKLELIMKKKGITILTGTKVESSSASPDTVTVNLSSGSANLAAASSSLTAEKALVCVGRAINSANLGLEKAGIKTERNRILVNKYLQTNFENIYAIGDCIGGLLLAHVASYEGVIAAENILQEKKEVDYRVVPNCIFTQPEIGCVGLSEETAKQSGVEVKIGRFPFTALGKAQVIGKTEGLVKIIIDGKTDKILGAAILGAGATELISSIAVAMHFEATSEQLERIIFAHPTLSEAIKEAAESVHKRAIHSL